MFILKYFTIFVILFDQKIVGFDGNNFYNENDDGWGLFLSVSQGTEDEFPSYDIGHWTKQLHLQQCAFVEIGEEFCALFVELRSIPSGERKILDSSGVSEFFLGLCECATVRSWILCSDQLMKRRKSDCIFTEAVPSANTSARVHRRLCDVTLLTKYAEPCNCSVPMANQQLYRTEGFPTCFRTPLPESICSPRGVCGVAQCCATTIKGIHSPQCDPQCHEKQPFCEEIGPWTSVPPEITSMWSHWSTPICMNSEDRIFSTSTSICLNEVTGQPAIDCIGPGSFCCPVDAEPCTCIVTYDDGVLKAIRMVESTLCLLDLEEDGVRTFREAFSRHRKTRHQKQRIKDPDYLPDHDNFGESVEYESESSDEDPTIRFRRRLMFASYDAAESENRADRSVRRSVNSKKSNKASVNDEIGDDDDDDDEDEEEDEEDEEEDAFAADADAADEDFGADDENELAENGEDDAENTESSEAEDGYVRRAPRRDSNTKKTGYAWSVNERVSRFARSNPASSISDVHTKRENENGSKDECDEPEGGSGLDGPLQYSEYDEDEYQQSQGKAEGGNGDDFSLSKAVIGGILNPHLIFWPLIFHICIIALCIPILDY